MERPRILLLSKGSPSQDKRILGKKHVNLNGQYTPHGTHLSYLSAGSPVIVANLWEVTDKDIDRFGKAMIDAWLREISSPSVVCAQYRLVAELKSMSITGGKRDANKKIPMKNKVSVTSLGTVNMDADHDSKLFVQQNDSGVHLPPTPDPLLHGLHGHLWVM